ncbi:MAG: hypothetical protein NWF01_05580 [Candidatus Bathyarchaeota archaeon]|nr:hypothetical protein [Candidatus Bathyarchaeota archaeon]
MTFNPNISPKRISSVSNQNITIKKPQRNKVALSVSLKVIDEAKPENLQKGVAYAFSKGGALIAKANLDSKGTAQIVVDLPLVETTQSIRLIVGPNLTEKQTVTELLRLGGEQVYVQISPKTSQKSVVLQVISKQILCWLLSRCIVHGSVFKKVVSGGITMDLPVCDATVEIYEVDPIYLLIPKLPIEIIDRIREFIIKPPFPQPPLKQIYERPPSIGPIPPQPLVIGNKKIRQISNDKQNIETPLLAQKSLCLDENYAETSPSVQSLLAGEDMQNLRILAQTTNNEQFKQVLIKYATITKSILCLFPYIGAHMDLVATTTTAECGKFKAMFFRGCNNIDKPDLYFKVKQKIFAPFPPISIYAPTPVLCHTFWNYQCGTQDVTLYVTHPLARTCAPCQPVDAPLNWVLFMAIGNQPLSKIRGTGVQLAATTTNANMGLTDTDAPFGETLRPRLEFDNSLREELGVKYYRVSYRKGTSGAFIPLTAPINRHYTHEVGDDLVLEAYNLGPKSEKSPGVPLENQNLFEIPPALPPVGQWSIPDAVEDTASAKFPTLNLAALQDPGVAWPESAQYQLKVDLFDSDGQLVNIDALQINFRVPTSTDLSGTIETEDAASSSLKNGLPLSSGLIYDDDGDGKKSMIITLNIDNSLCNAEIPAPTLDGVPAGDDCGVMKYDFGPAPLKEPQGTVILNYRPEHPSGVGTSGFATYSFSLTRGGNPASLIDSGRTPLPLTTKTATVTVPDILGICDTAGFVEHMHVYAMATSGWRRLHEYDAQAVRGFVLAPKGKQTGP